jgi:hypothetical protein
MVLESAIIERVEVFARHPVFEGSDAAMESVLDELRRRADSNEITRSTYLRLRELILDSPHFARNN